MILHLRLSLPDVPRIFRRKGCSKIHYSYDDQVPSEKLFPDLFCETLSDDLSGQIVICQDTMLKSWMFEMTYILFPYISWSSPIQFLSYPRDIKVDRLIMFLSLFLSSLVRLFIFPWGGGFFPFPVPSFSTFDLNHSVFFTVVYPSWLCKSQIVMTLPCSSVFGKFLKDKISDFPRTLYKSTCKTPCFQTVSSFSGEPYFLLKMFVL